MNTRLNLSWSIEPSSQSCLASYAEQDPPTWMPSLLLQAVTEGLVDGILILTPSGDSIYCNNHAQRLCQRLSSSWSNQALPTEIWRICEALIESRSVFPNQPVVLEDEIGDRKFPEVRVRVQWIELGNDGEPCLLVMLEDRRQSLHSLAITESQKYGLTSRESEVWFRQRSNYTYEEIATELHITVNTVKKHIKSIRAKRQSVWWDEQCN